MEVVSGSILVDLGDTTFLGAQAAGEVAEVIDGERDVGVQGFTDRLAVVDGFGIGQQFEVLFEAVGDLQQDVGTGCGIGLAPGRDCLLYTSPSPRD